MIALLILLAIAVVVSYLRFPRQKSVEKLTFGPGTKAPVRPRASFDRMPLPPSGSLRLDLIDRAVTEPKVSRDILKPIFVDEVKMAAIKQEEAKKPPPPPPPPTPAEIARKQAAGFKSLGMLRKSGVQTVFLARGDEVLLVRTGDTPVAGYAVSAITDSSLYMRSLSGDDEFSISLR